MSDHDHSAPASPASAGDAHDNPIDITISDSDSDRDSAKQQTLYTPIKEEDVSSQWDDDMAAEESQAESFQAESEPEPCGAMDTDDTEGDQQFLTQMKALMALMPTDEVCEMCDICSPF